MLGFRNRVIENLDVYLTEKAMADLSKATDKKVSEFHARFCPFVHQIYRGALIVTRNPVSASKLQVDIYLKAFMAYSQNEPINNFEPWLAEIVHESFSVVRFHKLNLVNAALGYEVNPVSKICSSQKAAQPQPFPGKMQ